MTTLYLKNFFLSNISDFMRNIAINNPIKLKDIVIDISGHNILGSIEGEDNLLILAGWWSVFHQLTENLMIGRLIDPTIIKTAVIFSPTSKFENECLKNIIIK